MNRKWLLLALGLGGFAAGLSIWQRGRGAAGPVGPGLRPATMWMAAGASTFDLHMKLSAAVAGQPILDMQVDGPLAVEPSLTGGRLVLQLAFTGDLHYKTSPADIKGAVEDSIVRDFRQPFVLEYGPQGDFQGVRSAPDAMPFVGQIWQSLGAALQFKRAPSQAGDDWQVEEVDSIGRYVAMYRRASVTSIEKTKRNYVSTHNARVAYEPPSARALFRFQSGGALDQVDADERVRSAGAAPLPSFASVTTIALRRTGGQPGSGPRLASKQIGNLPLVRPEDGPGGLSSHETDVQRAGGRDLTEVLATLRATLGNDKELSKEDKKRFNRAFVALAGLLALHPEALASIKGQIASRDPLAVTLIAALRDARTPEAQAALRDLLTDGKLDDTLRGLVARDLSLVQAPTPETVAMLESMRADPKIGVQATYGVGSTIHKLEKTDPALAENALRRLTADLGAATSDDQRSVLLTALGNAGQASSVEVIEPLVSSEAARVRVAATQALRRISGDRAEGLLIKLAGDANDDVRFGAVDALSERPPTAAEAEVAAALALAEPVAKTRFRAAELAGAWMPKFPGLRATLEEVAAHDANEQIRRVARLALDKHRSNI